MARTFLIDTDTASDNAAALIMALRAPGIDIKAMTPVSGNANVDQAVTNDRFDTIITPQEIDQLRALHTPLAGFTAGCNATAITTAHEQSGKTGVTLLNPVTMAVAFNPSICKCSRHRAADIAIHTNLTRGMAVIDRLDATHDERNREQWQVVRAQGQVRVCWQIDVPRCKQIVFAAVAERGVS